MTKRLLLVLSLIIVAVVPRPKQQVEVRIASKKFTESVILGEMMRCLVESTGISAQHVREVGGTRLVFEALRNGEIDAYPEYTGTLLREIFAGRSIDTIEQLRDVLDEQGIGISNPLGFNNTYALGMQRDRAEQAGIRRVSDLRGAGELTFGFSNEFVQRTDGWPGLRATYGLAPEDVKGLDHDIAYRQLQLGLIDVMDVYTTDARIDALDIKVLEDDRQYFPRYDAVILYRKAAAQEFPQVVKSMLRLEGGVHEEDMIRSNRAVEIDGRSETQVAFQFVSDRFDVDAEQVEPTRTERVTARTIEHLDLVRRSLLPAILLAIPLGVLASRHRWLGQSILAVTGVIQTIPALALLVLMMPVAAFLRLESIGAGSATAIMALFLYSLLPIVRNTYTGLAQVDPALIESAAVLNLPRWFRLLEIELPLASRAILAGVKTAAVLNVGFATLGALVAAGGYGQPILAGIRLANTSLILEGAIPAALLALAVQGLFELVELWIVPKGLRLSAPGKQAA